MKGIRGQVTMSYYAYIGLLLLSLVRALNAFIAYLNFWMGGRT